MNPQPAITEADRYQAANTIAEVHRHFERVSSPAAFALEIKYALSRLYYRLQKGLNNSFMFTGKRLAYFYHRYNMTWRSERVVEISIAANALEKFKGKRVLEIGNVLTHYGFGGHDVVDRYEIWPGVMNVDLVDFRPKLKYDFIVSVSTFEHMGHDEEVRTPDKPRQALKHLLDHCLASGGAVLITFPVGHNPYLDKMAFENDSFGLQSRFLKRLTASNSWREATPAEVRGSRYNDPFPFANGLGVLSSGVITQTATMPIGSGK